MKALHWVGRTVLGALFAVGCSSTDTTTDAGVTGDTGAKVDTGTAETTAETSAETTPGDTATETDPGKACQDCVSSKCGAELGACAADAACKKLLDCLGKCAPTPDHTCEKACISANPTPKGDAVIACIQSKCSAECP